MGAGKASRSPETAAVDGRPPPRPRHEKAMRLLHPLVTDAGSVVYHIKGHDASNYQETARGAEVVVGVVGGATPQTSSESRETSSFKGGTRPTIVVAGPVNRTRAQQAATSTRPCAHHTKQRGTATTTRTVGNEAAPTTATELEPEN